MEQQWRPLDTLWVTGWVMCQNCGHRHISVHPVTVLRVACSNCHEWDAVLDCPIALDWPR